MEGICSKLDQERLARFARNPTVQPKHQWAPAFLGGVADLHSAVLSNSINEVRGLLGAGANVTMTDRDGRTPLTIARQLRYTELAHYIASEHDELVRVLGKCLGRTPTQMEIYGVATIDKMRGFRQKVREHTQTTGAQLVGAARAGDLATVKRLLESGEIGADVIDQATDETAWSAALSRSRGAVYNYLMERGVKMHGVCHIEGKRHSTLVAAVLTADPSFVREVVTRGAPVVPAEDNTTDTCALIEAARLGSIEMVQALLDLGVRFDYSKKDLQLPKPFDYLLGFIRNSRATATEASLWLVLCAACWFNDLRLFKYLINRYLPLQDQRERPRCSAVVLIYAVYRQNEAMVSELLQRGAFVSSGDTPSAMFAAVMGKSARMLELLLQYTSNVGAIAYYAIKESKYQDCVLSVAVYLDARDCIALLLPLETRPYYRLQAFKWAIAQDNIEVASLLADSVLPLGDHDTRMCIWATKSPVMVDFLLSRLCGDDLSISSASDIFASAVYHKPHPDLLSVYVAHGLDVVLQDESDKQMSRTITNTLYGQWGRPPNPAALRFLVENGVSIVRTNEAGETLELDLLNREKEGMDPLQTRQYEACRAILAEFS